MNSFEQEYIYITLEGVEIYLKNFAQDESRWKSGWKLVGETIRSKRDWEFGEILQLQERERERERDIGVGPLVGSLGLAIWQ